MGGRNKLLAKVDGKPMIRRVVEAALSSKVDEVIVVLGHQAEKIRKALADLPCRLVVNKDYEKGQSGSVKVGLSEVGEATRAILVLPGDMAKIDARSINLVIDEYEKENSPILVVAHHSRLGHPILFTRALFEEIRQISEETYGLKSVIKKHEDEMRLVEADSEDVLTDIDTLEDLEKL